MPHYNPAAEGIRAAKADDLAREASGSRKIIAEYKAPKQRMTIHYGYQIVENTDQGEWRYSVEQIDLVHGQVIDCDDELCADTAWLLFHSHIEKNSKYLPNTWEA